MILKPRQVGGEMPEMPKDVPPLKQAGVAKWMKEEKAKEWKRITGLLAGQISEADAAALYVYCTSLVEYRVAIHMIQTHGQVVERLTHHGPIERPSPWLAIAESAIKNIARLQKAFGLSPRDRADSKVDSTPASDGDEFFDT